MGNKNAKEGITKKFERQLSVAIRSSPEEFSDLVVVSSDGKEHHKNKFRIMIAFPKLRKHLLDHDRLDTFLSDKVIDNLDEYAVSETLPLDNHILELVGVLLELVPIERLREKITKDVFHQVKEVMSLEKVHETLTVPAMAALVFVAKIHDMEVFSHLSMWINSRPEFPNDPARDVFCSLLAYSRTNREDFSNPLLQVSRLMRKKPPAGKLLKNLGKAEEVSTLLFVNED